MAEAVNSPLEQRVLLRNASWGTYERLVAERGEQRRVPRLFYDRGVLELASPSAMHEVVSRIVAELVSKLALELEIDVLATGSTTFGREDLERGFDPDQSLYFSGNARSVREIVRRKGEINLETGIHHPTWSLRRTSPALRWTSSRSTPDSAFRRCGVAPVGSRGYSNCTARATRSPPEAACCHP